MKTYYYHIRLFIFRFLLLLGIFSISRILFYFFNYNYFNSINVIELFKILIAGIRFDISALYYFNILFILFSIVPGKFKNHKIYQIVIFTIFIVINSILLATNFIDTKFFDFENKRLTSDIFSSVWLGKDFRTLLPQFIKDYWYLIAIWGFFVSLLIKLYPKLKNDLNKISQVKIKHILYQALIFIFLMCLGLLGGRGGLQLKPLKVIHAAEYTSARNIPLVLNTPFTLMKSIGSKTLEPKHYFTKEVLDSIYSPIIEPHNVSDGNKPNIVIIILESFTKEYIGALNNGSGYTPFLDSLIEHSLYFPNAFANGKRSIEAMSSIVTGLPSLQDNPYITSKYFSNTVNSIPGLLNELGYHTSFFHGGENGTMGFDLFANITEYKEYYGMTEFDNKDYFDDYWGIFDEEFFYFYEDKLNEFKEPFFSTFFTLTSHHPYPIPEKYEGKFPKGNLNIHETIGYTDFALKQFFNSIKNTHWYNNTLFVFVADHTAQAEKKKYNNNLGMYSIPIVFYHPNDTSLQGKSEIIAQQTDIFPTIMDYINYDKPFVCFGNSLLNDSVSHFSVNYINGIYQLIEDNFLIQFDGNKTIALYDIQKDSLLLNNLLNNNIENKNIENKLKAIIQSYQERLVNNQLTLN